MPEVPELASMRPQPPTATHQPPPSAGPTAASLLTSTTLLPQDKLHLEVHTIVIVVIFCVVCFLLLLAFFYAFCFHCSIGVSLRDSHTTSRCSQEREDATYKRSSSENLSVANVV